jgi:hypothetical protein
MQAFCNDLRARRAIFGKYLGPAKEGMVLTIPELRVAFCGEVGKNTPKSAIYGSLHWRAIIGEGPSQRQGTPKAARKFGMSFKKFPLRLEEARIRAKEKCKRFINVAAKLRHGSIYRKFRQRMVVWSMAKMVPQSQVFDVNGRVWLLKCQ